MIGQFDFVRLFSGLGSSSTQGTTSVDALSRLSALQKYSGNSSGRTASDRGIGSAFTDKKEAFSKLQTRLLSLKSAAQDAQDSEEFTPLKGTSGDASAYSVAASSAASQGEYAMEVDRLASHATVSLGVGRDADDVDDQGAGVSASSRLLEDRTFSFGYNNQSYDVSLKAGDSLSDVATRINDTDYGDAAGVRAMVLNSEDGASRLVLSAQDSGALERDANGDTATARLSNVQITDGSGNSASMAFGGTTVTQDDFFTSQAGQDARFTLDGVGSYSASNTVDGLVEGVTLQLTGLTESATTLSIENDADALKSRLQTLVDAYNAVVDVVDEELRDDFSGEALIRRLSGDLREVLNTPSQGVSGDYETLAEVGVQTVSGGRIEIDDDKFASAVANDFHAVSEIVAGDPEIGEQGLAIRLENLVNGLTGTGGEMTNRLTALDQRIAASDDNPEQLSREASRLNQYQNAVADQFTNLDQMRASLTDSNNLLMGSLRAMGWYG